MYAGNRYIVEVKVLVIMMISRNDATNWHFFLRKQNATLWQETLGPVCSDLLQKFFFAPFSFF